MYDFIELNESRKLHSLPSLAMEYDGYFLENEIKGYTTLKVKGREMANLDMEVENPSGRDGSMVTGQALKARELTITYMLKADSNEEFQYLYSLLMKKLLKLDDVSIRFIDQPDVFYHGRYESSDEIDDDTNWVVSSFKIYCQDPYKYNEALELKGDPLTIGYLTHYSIKPDEIKIIVGSATTKIAVDNITTGRHIILNGSYAVGDEIKIRIPDNEIKKNGQNIMNNLDPQESDFHSFLVNNGDVINVTPNSQLSLMVRGRTL